MKAIFVSGLVLLLFLMGCQPEAEMTAVPTQAIAEVEQEAEPTAMAATAVAATATPILPTATAPPTETPVSPTETPAPTPTDEPLPEVSVETLTGIWTHFDAQDQGNNWLIFAADGSYEAKHGPSPETGILVLEGVYRVEAGVVTFTDVDECPTGEPYDARFVTQTRIAFDLKEQCGALQLLPDQRGWMRDE